MLTLMSNNNPTADLKSFFMFRGNSFDPPSNRVTLRMFRASRTLSLHFGVCKSNRPRLTLFS